MNQNENYGFGTRAIHEGNVKDKMYGALATPIYQSSTFVFDNCAQGGKRFAGEEEGFIYTRLGNPTTSILEKKFAALEGAEAAAFTAAGMGAISAMFWSLLGAGKHLIADATLYGCTYALISHGLTRYGVEVTFIDSSNLDEVRDALKDNTAVVYLETPANPNLKITDIKAVADIAHAYNPDIQVVVDNTFATPYLQRPLELGADIVVHSATKYINGHGDVVAGVVCGKEDFIKTVKGFGIKDMTGSVLGGFEAFLILRGLKTFELRMQRHCANAMAVAEFLTKSDKVAKVYYPGLKDHPGHDIAEKQMDGFGGVLSFEVKGGRAAGEKLLNNLKLCTLAVSLGDAETLVEHPASMTHSAYTSEELAEAGIPEGLIRASIGLENVEDIIADLEQGLALL